MTDDELKAAVCRIFKFGEDKWFDYADEFRQLIAQARADALEEAAKVAHELASAWHTADEISAAIRARKDDHG